MKACISNSKQYHLINKYSITAIFADKICQIRTLIDQVKAVMFSYLGTLNKSIKETLMS